MFSVCGITADSLTYCWGAGQLNNEAEQAKPVLVAAPKLGSISVGTHQELNLREMLCGSTATREIVCRGSAAGGLTTVPGSAGFDKVSVGGALCALAEDGTARCWRYTSYEGLLGVASSEGIPQGSPVTVEGGLRFTSLDVGMSNVCGVVEDGATYCWGYNHALQISFDPSIGLERIPRAVTTAPTSFASITNLQLHTCALATDGRAFCWGLTQRGRLGRTDLETVDCPGVSDGTTGQPAPCYGRPVEVAGGRQFSAIVTGSHHACAIDAGGHLYCWGSGTWGELGNGHSGVANWTGAPVRVAGSLRFRAVTAGQFFTCAVATNDATYCWGTNQLGQLGAGLPPGNSAAVPTPVAAP
jgi:hypothetical protein